MSFGFNSASTQYLSTTSTPVSAAPMTIAAWFYPTSTAAASVICSVGVAAGSDRFTLYSDLSLAGNKVGAQSIASGVISEATYPNVVVLNTWQHGASVFESTTSRYVYHNGVASTQNTASSSPSGVDSITIGARRSPAIGVLMNGSIAQLGIWDAALTADEIASLADGMICSRVRPQNLKFYAPLVRELIDIKARLTITNNNSASVGGNPRLY